MLFGMHETYCDGDLLSIPIQFRNFIEKVCGAAPWSLLIHRIEFNGISATPVPALRSSVDAQQELAGIDATWMFSLPPSIQAQQRTENTNEVVIIGCWDRFEVFTPQGWEQAARQAEKELPWISGRERRF